VFFKGRTIVYQEQGQVLLLKFADELEDIAVPESMPQLLGKKMTMILAPRKSKLTTNNKRKQSNAKNEDKIQC
jgi:translation initiation factor IF-3